MLQFSFEENGDKFVTFTGSKVIIEQRKSGKHFLLYLDIGDKMRGCPRTFATKQASLSGIETYPEETKAELRRLIAGRFEFVQTAELADGEDGITDDTHQVVAQQETDPETGKKVEKRIQLEMRESENARLFRLGFTLEEAQKLAS